MLILDCLSAGTHKALHKHLETYALDKLIYYLIIKDTWMFLEQFAAFERFLFGENKVLAFKRISFKATRRHASIRNISQQGVVTQLSNTLFNLLCILFIASENVSKKVHDDLLPSERWQ